MNLNEFSKEDLLIWIKRNTLYRSMQRSDLLFIKWERLVKEMEAKIDRLSDELKAIDLKKHDEYIVAFQAATSDEECSRLLNLLAPYQAQLNAWLKKQHVLDREDKKLDKIYESIEAARQLEGAK